MFVGIGVGIGRNRFAQGIFNAYNLRVVADGGITEAGNCVNAVSSLLQSASLLIIPSGYKGGKAYAEIPTNGNGDFTWTRASDAWRTNADGLIQRVPWNLLQRSEEFDNAIWNKINLSVTANTTTAPNGTTTADKLIENTSAGFHRAVQTISGFVGSVLTYSVYLKASERTWALVWFDGEPAGAYVNLTTGALGTVSSGVTASVTNVGDGWFRCIISKTIVSGANVAVYTATGNNGASYTGDGTSGIFVWGAQLVEGSSAQTYFPTTDRLNVPRLSYMYGSCPALLLEPQRTNLALQSETFDNASWNKVAISITANSTTSPDGNITADTLSADGTSSSHFITQSLTVTSGVTYSLSYYAKKNTNDFVQVFFNNGFGVNAFANFNINTGVIGTIGSSATATITNAGNGWYRCSITATATSTTTNNVPSLAIVNSNTATIAQTNTLSTSVFLYGAQLEAGAYPTTYIPTTSASATRVADSFSRNNIYTNGLITSSGGTWFVELRGNVAYLRDSSVGFGIGDTSGLDANALFLRIDSTSSARLAIMKRVSGSVFGLHTTTTDTTKIAIKWNGSTADVFVNGTKQVSATTFTATIMQFFQVATTQGVGVPLFIQAMALYPTPLSDTDCTTITTL